MIAIADGDEWDDTGDPDQYGPMQTVLTSPSISVADATANSLTISFDSSWREEEPQIGWVSVSFDGGEESELLKLNSAGVGMPFKESNLNETIELGVNNPEGAKEMKVSFGYQAVNNWWWAIDNIQILTKDPGTGGKGSGININLNPDGQVSINWTPGSRLQSAPSVNGPWTDVVIDTGNDGQLTLDPQSHSFENSAVFFRTRD